MAKYDIDLRDYWRIIRKRRTIVLLTLILFTVFSYFFALARSPKPLYQATSAVKVERVADPANRLFGIIPWTGWDHVTTQVVIINSFPIAERAAKSLDLIPDDAPSAEVQSNRDLLEIVSTLKSKVVAEREEATNVINITATSGNPGEAARLANAVAEVFRQANVEERNERVRETREFIEKELKVMRLRLLEAEENLRRFQEESNLVALDTQTTAALNQLAKLESGKDSLQQRQLEVRKQLEFLQQDGKVAPWESLYLDKPHALLARLMSNFADLSLRHKTLLLEYFEEHPHVKEVAAELQHVRSEIEQELSSMLASLDRQILELERSIQLTRARTLSIPQSALILSRLRREVKVKGELYAQLQSRHQEVLIQESGQIQEVKTIKPALEPSIPMNKANVLMKTVTGSAIGLVLGLVLALIVETLDTSLGTIEDVEGVLGIPVLGVIPSGEGFGVKEKDKIRGKGKSDALVTHFAPRSPTAEAYRSLRTSLLALQRDKKAKSLLVTSSSLQEGKTYNVVNLSLSMAQAGEKVLLIDADLRRPTIHGIFCTEKEPGLTNYIMGDYDWHPYPESGHGLPTVEDWGHREYGWKSVVNTITDFMLGDFDVDDILETPGLENLHIMTAGSNPDNPLETLRSTQFKQFLREAGEYYDVIIVDTPPVLPVADAFEVAPEVDGVILVYEVGRIGRGILNRAKVQLENVNADVLGVVLNNVKPEVAPDFYGYQTQYYYGAKSEQPKTASTSRWDGLIDGSFLGVTSKLASSPGVKGKSSRTLISLLLIGIVLTVGVLWQVHPEVRSLYSRLFGVNEGASASWMQESEFPVAACQPVRPEEPSEAVASLPTPDPPREISNAAGASGTTEQVFEMSARVNVHAPEEKPANTTHRSVGSQPPIPREPSATENSLSSHQDGSQLCVSVASLAKIRTGPTVEAPVLQRIPQGTRLRVVAREGEWLKLKLQGGDSGWIYHTLVNTIEESGDAREETISQQMTTKPQVSLPSMANIRSRPDSDAPIVARISQGTNLDVVGKEGGWLRLQLRTGDNGWIHHTLVSNVD